MNIKDRLLGHLSDLDRTVSACLYLGIEYSYPVDATILEFIFEARLNPASVNCFSDISLLLQSLIKKQAYDEFKRNPSLFQNSIYQIEAIVANSLLNTSLINAKRFYEYIFLKSHQESSNSRNRTPYTSRHTLNIVYSIIRYSIKPKINDVNLILGHIKILNQIYTSSLDYSIFLLLFSFKFFAAILDEQLELLKKFDNFHELNWSRSRDIHVPEINASIDCTDTMAIEVYSIRDALIFEKQFNPKNNGSKFGYFLSYPNGNLYSMNPHNCLNNTFLPFTQIFLEALSFGALSRKTKIFMKEDSTLNIPSISVKDLRKTPIVSHNSYLIVNDQCNWYHFVIDTIIPLYQILLTKRYFFKNILVSASVYDNKNRLELLRFLVKLSQDSELKIIRFDEVIRVENLFWSAICFPRSNYQNNIALSDGSSWPSHILTNFSKDIRSSISLPSMPAFKNIYLKRSPSLKRHCKNIEEVEALIVKKFEFEPVELEKYSFQEQVSILSNCGYVVGPTGAAWTNIIFCDSLKKVKAICWGVSEKLHNFWLPLAISANVQIVHIYAPDYHSFEVDCDHLSKLLKSM